MLPTTCAQCGEGGGSLAPYRDVARANGWAHEYAHLDCARYRVSTVLLAEPMGTKSMLVLPHVGEPWLFEYRYD